MSGKKVAGTVIELDDNLGRGSNTAPLAANALKRTHLNYPNLAMNDSSPNPYEPPRLPAAPSRPDFSDRSQEMQELPQRIETLEKQVAGSWFVQPNWLKRAAAVWGYFFLGYGFVLLVVFLMLSMGVRFP